MILIVEMSDIKDKIKAIANQFMEKALTGVDNLKTANSKESFKKIIEFVVERKK